MIRPATTIGICNRTIAAAILGACIGAHADAGDFFFTRDCGTDDWYETCFDNQLGLWRNNFGRTAQNQQDLVFPASADTIDVLGNVVLLTGGTTTVGSISTSLGGGGLINEAFLNVDTLDLDSFRQDGNPHFTNIHGGGGDGPGATIGTMLINGGGVFFDEGVGLIVEDLIFNSPSSTPFNCDSIDAGTVRFLGGGTVELGTDFTGAFITIEDLYDVTVGSHFKDGGITPLPELWIKETGRGEIKDDHLLELRFKLDGELDVIQDMICGKGGELSDLAIVDIADGASFEVHGLHGSNPFFICSDISTEGTGELVLGDGVEVPALCALDWGNTRMRRNATWNCLGSVNVAGLILPGAATINGGGTGALNVLGAFEVGSTDVSREIRDLPTCLQGPATWDEGRFFSIIGRDFVIKNRFDATGTDPLRRELHLGFNQSFEAGDLIVDGPDGELHINFDVLFQITGFGDLINNSEMKFNSNAESEIFVDFNGRPGSALDIERNTVRLHNGNIDNATVNVEPEATLQLSGITGLTIVNNTIVNNRGTVRTAPAPSAQPVILNNITYSNIDTAITRFSGDDDVRFLNSFISNTGSSRFELEDSEAVLSGTSLSQPHTTGLFALIRSRVEVSDSTFTGGSIEGDGNSEIDVLAEFGIDRVKLLNTLLPGGNPDGSIFIDGTESEPSELQTVTITLTNGATGENRGMLIATGDNTISATPPSRFENRPGAMFVVRGGETTIKGAFFNEEDVLVEFTNTILNIGSPDGQQPAGVTGSGDVTVDAATLRVHPGSTVDEGGVLSLTNGAILEAFNANVDLEQLVLQDADAAIRNNSELNGFEWVIVLSGLAVAVGHSPGPDSSTLEVVRRFSFDMTDESMWQWGPDAVLALTGGIGAQIGEWDQWTRLEVGGFDLGNDPAGFDSNFDLSILRIDPGAQAYLEDQLDNGNRTPGPGGGEALYVDTLEFADASGRLNLNGLNLYFTTLIGDPAQIIDTPVAECPDTFNVIFGFFRSGTVNELCASDDQRLVIEQRPAFTPLLPLIRLDITGAVPTDDPAALTIVAETSTTAIPSQPLQRLLQFNYDTSAFENLDERTTTVQDSAFEVIADANAGRFIQDGTLEVRSRLEWFDPGNVFSPAWVVRIDQFGWAVTP